MTIAQPSRMRLRESKVYEGGAQVKEWGEAMEVVDGKSLCSFLRLDDGHLFAVSLRESLEADHNGAKANEARPQRLNFYGEVLAQQGGTAGTDIESPVALRIDDGHWPW